jgi:hypothetical protein
MRAPLLETHMELDLYEAAALIRQIETAAIAAIAADPLDAECISATACDELNGLIKTVGLCRPAGSKLDARSDAITRATVAQTAIARAAERVQAPLMRISRHRAGILA